MTYAQQIIRREVECSSVGAGITIASVPDITVPVEVLLQPMSTCLGVTLLRKVVLPSVLFYVYVHAWVILFNVMEFDNDRMNAMF